MKTFLWNLLARQLARPRVAEALIHYAKRTPYMHLPSNENPSYMERYWVFNPYDRETNVPRWASLIPWSFRVHHIKREDTDRHMHDHPWDARTIILKGWYVEKRLVDDADWCERFGRDHTLHIRRRGDTAPLRFGEYHSITEVSEGGVYTLFISGRWRGVWGFLVNGVKVPWKKYLGLGE
ncbi:hypothetical protein SAMN05216577_11616 [Pseudomonas citronellolis]|uniref:Uncharacterized protein n=1 Tax=Pseudomonas citronellolis TaxID=53408 RepID=A0AAQ1KGB6_9PSED|nr:hypothetical protein [Pseudomonas citronellolis]TGC32382.1 hypothetical protein CW310_01800 [Pseudomonas citronellolis]SFD07419.1 hypothetical protein SAMN05216577_11616 [Pseudomonas citronellolis]